MQYILGTSEYRELSQAEKSIKLVEKESTSFRKAGETVGLNHGQVSRAVAAVKSNRDPGTNGRPRSLNQADMSIFLQKIRDEMSQGVKLTHQDARNLVSYHEHQLWAVSEPFYSGYASMDKFTPKT